jgi:hypothetical protein
MKLKHKYVRLWKESGLLDELRDEEGNVKPLSWYIKRLPKAAEKLAKNEADPREAYKDYYGWLGEVLCEFWLKKFGHRYDIAEVTDTSENQFTRGYDFTARSFFAEELKSQIQVKMRSDPEKTFLLKDLYTFFDEGQKAGILPQYLVLMVPTSSLTHQELLSYKNDFKRDYLPRIRVINQAIMQSNIHELPSTRGHGGNEEFFTSFREAVTEATQLQSNLHFSDR